ncbi:type II secretion system F family protein [Halomonas cibimaris]|uniref:Type II secretion system F family protein n=1 Tax=Halomonas cibimaris TaxID=657012 RepID=A0ABP7L9L9_9GAMM
MARAPRSRRQAEKLYRWKWKGTSADGHKVRGTAISASRAEVKSTLQRQNITVRRIRKRLGGPGKVTPLDVALFARQMATMTRAGIPLLQALEVIRDSLDKPAMVALLRRMIADVTAGSSFSDTLRRQPRHFDRLFVNLVHVGEQAGAMDDILSRLASYKEAVESLKGRVKKAMWYPGAVMAMGIGVTIILLVKVVPQFESMFQSFNAELPAITRITIHLSEQAQQYWLHALGAVMLAGLAFRYMHRRSEKFAYRVDAWLLSLPIVGDILHMSAVARFSRTLATTFSSGVPLADGLKSTAGSTGNRVYESAVLRARDDVIGGRPLNFAVRMTNMFPTQVVQMLSIGEETGALDAMLNRVADYYEEQVNNKVETLTSLMEPFIIAVLGLLVGGVVVAMYMPIFTLGTAM